MLGEAAQVSFEVEQLRTAVDAGARLLTQLDQLSHGLVLQPCAVELSERVLGLKGLLTELTAVLRVADDGPGISDNVLPRVFDPRITTKANGQGLGLATVKAIVEGHHGKVMVHTSPRGTTFELAFPLASGQ